MKGFNSLGAIMYSDELVAISKQLKQPIGRIVTMQLIYELTACCSSVVAKNKDSFPFHFRTMDFETKFYFLFYVLF